MQDLHAIGGGGGRLFGGGGDRRLRPLNHPNNQALKCPRCDSLNTKFCYYNNYNLSQPRHFCKSCRRYWTKGGVLRNVPVGGGCRKTKRSKHKPSSDTSKDRKSNSHSSSESSSLTASTTAATAAATAEVVSGSSSTSASTLINCPDSRFFVPQTTNTSFDPPVNNPSHDGGIFPEIGSFTSMMASSIESPALGFNVAGIPSYRLQQQHNEVLQDAENQSMKQHWHEQQKLCASIGDELGMHEITTGFMDNQTAEIEFPGSQNRTSNCGGAAVDWQAGVDQGMFDLTGSVDPSYWTHNQWTENDHHLNYLP